MPLGLLGKTEEVWSNDANDPHLDVWVVDDNTLHSLIGCVTALLTFAGLQQEHFLQHCLYLYLTLSCAVAVQAKKT